MEELITSLINNFDTLAYSTAKFFIETGVYIRENEPFIKAILILFSLLMVVGILIVGRLVLKDFSSFRHMTWRDMVGLGGIYAKRHLGVWRKIEKYLKSGKPQKMKLAIMKADDLFGELLETMNYPGENFEKRIQGATGAQFSNLEDIKKAHKIAEDLRRNKNLVINREGAEKLVEVYKTALKELYVLK